MTESYPREKKKANVPFKERIPAVLKIIEEAEEPIQYKTLHEKLIEKTNVKISKHTLNKCLDNLLSRQYITKIEEKGVGNPVKYSVKRTHFYEQPSERIKINSFLFKQFADDYTPFGTEANLWVSIAEEISQLVTFLLYALYTYSKTSNENSIYAANEEYKETIDTVLVPQIIAMRELVQSPIKMSIVTRYILYRLFVNNINQSSIAPIHPDKTMSSEEMNELNKLVNVKDFDFLLSAETPEDFDLKHIENYEPLKNVIKTRKMLSEAYSNKFGEGFRKDSEYTKKFYEIFEKYREYPEEKYNLKM